MTDTNPPELSEADELQINETGRRLAIELISVKGLYSKISLSSPEGAVAGDLLKAGTVGTFDMYCTTCSRDTPFHVGLIAVANRGGGNHRFVGTPPSTFAVRAVCSRQPHFYDFVFVRRGDDVVKIGQLPSVGDISQAELKDVDKSLDKLDRKELGTALGLFAHDAASGAFVYLRRVFERMIYRAHDRYAEKNGKIEGFSTLRMDEKIAAIAGELPERVVQYKKVFSVLSAGIHELTDEQCQGLFPVVKAVVFQMLEQEEHKRRKAIADSETDRAFTAIQKSMFAAEPEAVTGGSSSAASGTDAPT